MRFVHTDWNMKNEVLVIFALCGFLFTSACEPAVGDDDDSAVGGDDDDSVGDDDSVVGDDDDSVGDEDSVVGDDDSSVGDDDDSAGPEPGQDIPPLSEEWAEVPSTIVWEGQGSWPSDGARAWAWHLPTNAAAADLWNDYGPMSGLTLADLQALFDESTQDLVVVTWWQDAAGELVDAQGVWVNTWVDCLCYGAWVHRDFGWLGMLPAMQHTTRVYAVNDLGVDSVPEFLQMDVLITERDLSL